LNHVHVSPLFERLAGRCPPEAGRAAIVRTRCGDTHRRRATSRTFFIRDGNVRIELEHPEFNNEIAKLGKGELFGEMSLLEGLPVSANVIADDRVEVDVCDAAHIADIFANDRELEGRFFKSLAYILSVRLRDTTLTGLA